MDGIRCRELMGIFAVFALVLLVGCGGHWASFRLGDEAMERGPYTEAARYYHRQAMD